MRVSDNESRVGAPGSGHELAGADQLISDLAALVDAGLLVIHESVLGPARYGVARSPVATTATEPRVHRSRVGIMRS